MAEPVTDPMPTAFPEGARATAVVIEAPGRIGLRSLRLQDPGRGDVIVDVAYTGISTGTEKLLYSGAMPPFPGLGYPLVPGYEAVGTICWAGPESERQTGEQVFVPGANCFDGARGLFGATASQLVVPADRVTSLPDVADRDAVLLALAATAQHALAACLEAGQAPGLIIGHGVLGRLLARLTLASGALPPTVWETAADRRAGALGYPVQPPPAQPSGSFDVIVDASGATGIVDLMVANLAPRGHAVLAGFYAEPVSFAFPPAFMREARLAVAAEWQPDDLKVVLAHLDAGRLRLDGLVSHSVPATAAATAFPTAFDDPRCLKMVLDWRNAS